MLRIDAILKDPFFEDYINRNNISEVHRKFCRHSFQHLVDVARITYILMLESGDITEFAEKNELNLKSARELVYASALLHDIGRWKEYETGEDHSIVSAELALNILNNAGFNEQETLIITTGIKEHRSRSDNKSILGKCLYKADKLSRLCSECEASGECYKYQEMETGRNKLVY